METISVNHNTVNEFLSYSFEEVDFAFKNRAKRVSKTNHTDQIKIENIIISKLNLFYGNRLSYEVFYNLFYEKRKFYFRKETITCLLIDDRFKEKEKLVIDLDQM